MDGCATAIWFPADAKIFAWKRKVPKKAQKGLTQSPGPVIDCAVMSATTTDPRVQALFEKLAEKHLGIETLQVRNSDRLDFHDVGVASLASLMAEVFEAGMAAGIEVGSAAK